MSATTVMPCPITESELPNTQVKVGTGCTLASIHQCFSRQVRLMRGACQEKEKSKTKVTPIPKGKATPTPPFLSGASNVLGDGEFEMLERHRSFKFEVLERQRSFGPFFLFPYDMATLRGT